MFQKDAPNKQAYIFTKKAVLQRSSAYEESCSSSLESSFPTNYENIVSIDVFDC